MENRSIKSKSTVGIFADDNVGWTAGALYLKEMHASLYPGVHGTSCYITIPVNPKHCKVLPSGGD